MDSETTETSTISMESFKLNKDLLNDLFTTVNEEYLKNLDESNEIEKEFISMKYALETKNKKIETKNFQTILKHWSPKNFKQAEMTFRGSKKDIRIRCGGYWNLEISVSGNDSIWVSGLTKGFEDMLDNYKSKNEFFHKPKAYLIYLSIPFLIGLGILMVVASLIGEQALDLETDATNNKQLSDSTILLIFVLTMSSWWGWSGLFHWLFPKIELEESTQPKIRKLILSVILSLIISLMAGGIIISIHSNLT